MSRQTDASGLNMMVENERGGWDSPCDDSSSFENSSTRPLSTIEEVDNRAKSTRTKTGTSSCEEYNHSDDSPSSPSSDGSSVIHWDGFDDGIGDEEDENSDISESDEKDRASDNREPDDVTNTSDGSSDDEDGSSMALSKKAEEILANAKKRLTSMEGNLHRARRSIMQTPSSALSTTGRESGSESPGFATGTRRFSSVRISSSDNHQLLPFRLNSPSTASHGRVFSETSIPSSLRSPLGSFRSGPRASSALGTTSLTRSLINGNDGPSFRPSGDRHGTRASVSGPTVNARSPLGFVREDMVTPSPVESSAGSRNPFSRSVDVSPSAPISKGRSFSNGNAADSASIRSKSSMQVRDLREQMNDLKGKISSLRDRTREDNLRRRSTQSLRTASPLHSAEQWYNNARGYHSGAVSTNAGYGWRHPESLLAPTGEEQETSRQDELEHSGSAHLDDVAEVDDQVMNVSRKSSIIVNQTEPSPRTILDPDSRKAHGNVQGSDSTFLGTAEVSDGTVSSTSTSKEASDSSSSESGPVGERHEDRPDAFDYEHIFIHSALANYAGQTEPKRGSSSVASEDSVATMKQDATSSGNFAHPPSSPNHLRVHTRTSSGDSISTMATFATATEGLGSDGEQNEDDEDEEDESNWTRYPIQPHIAQLQIKSTVVTTAPSAAAMPTSASTIIGATSTPVYEVQGSTRSPASTASPRTPRNIPLVKSPGTVDRGEGSGYHDFGDAMPMSEGRRAEAVFSRGLADGDAGLVEDLVASLVGVCSDLRRSEQEGMGNYLCGAWRRRLAIARRALDGDFDAKEL